MALYLAFVEKVSFIMGDTWRDGDSDEKPTHKVTLTYNICVGKYETTFDKYDAFCKATGRSEPSNIGWGREVRPVINVSWWDAIECCNWLSEREVISRVYNDSGSFVDSNDNEAKDPSEVIGCRLPSEAEGE